MRHMSFKRKIGLYLEASSNPNTLRIFFDSQSTPFHSFRGGMTKGEISQNASVMESP